MSKRKIGMWLYQNGGGDEIQKKIITKLNERDIAVTPGINLRDAVAKNSHIIWEDKKVDKLDLFFSYNAGEQTQYQVYLSKALNRIIPMINSFESFELSEDKFQTSYLLRQHGIQTADYKLCHRDDTHHLKTIMKKWNKMVYKPTDGWGGVGLTKIENQETLDMLMPFLNQMDLRYFYVEKFIDYDNTDYRVDIVDGQFVGCYGRKASGADWRTNVTSGGSVFMREPNDDVINLALNATKVTGLDIAGVDIIYDRKKEEYVVLEVNGIPAFATPEQEKMGLDFNNKKIDLIVDLIDRKTKK
ncbi:ATP-grasp domain-containing protein [Poseidonibacter ostreae]|jgi:ribosomal protein S6--L-glutamate ligase|uniref:ATP-grasp domain-containing protein n=1 Tax=Poseidonibacter ostreae TaxID=2654171 RepID=A0A6L4WT51_9BACT|nr:ATP-grasp domain-containing protein [Poseidonibacter ostreae]KAB7887106.1 ATP-grasp domain-containing protein [Poseidonibacter ostreae]KAB7889168.1 ATP-grasp domain-containing protein [Poseidonibacter ostreae]KAB7891631.1 ATP-grasp domain-containing protein [Poseidonibacter ostreae]